MRAVADAGLRQGVAPAALVLADNRRGGADAWFARHGLARPPAPDLRGAGFRYLGCRADVVAGHRAAILVYGAAGGTISVLAWPAGGEGAHPPRAARAGGLAVLYWSDGRLEYWVTGARAAAVARLARDYRRSG